MAFNGIINHILGPYWHAAWAENKNKMHQYLCEKFCESQTRIATVQHNCSECSRYDSQNLNTPIDSLGNTN